MSYRRAPDSEIGSAGRAIRTATERRRGGVAVLAVAALLAGVAPAGAAPFTPSLDRAYNVALRFWGRSPVNCTSLDREIVSDAEIEGYEGEATIAATPGPCILYVRRSLAQRSQWIRACGVLVHEVGHLLGYEHSDNPRNIMYPVVERPAPICFRAGTRELNRRRGPRAN